MAAVALAFALSLPASAQSPFVAQLESQHLGNVQPGTYEAGDKVQFTIDRDGQNYLLRFAGAPEVFVLYPRNASLGGRVLKYDTGKTAIRIAGWGGMTLYTDKNPDGLPAVRTGAPTPLQLPAVTMDDIQQAATDEAKQLAAAHGLKIGFQTDWNSLAHDPELRALCFDAMENAARGLARFAAQPAGLKALKDRVSTVSMRTSHKPTLALKDHALIVTYDPRTGFIGRASSRAIARALHIVLHVPDASDD